jgi:hypothetical protein
MKSTIIKLPSSHVAMLSHPTEVLRVIEEPPVLNIEKNLRR